MELTRVVYNAARDGKLYRLTVFLDHKPKEEVAMLVSVLTNDATPLIMACRNGHLDVALYLIEKCHANVEQVGSIEAFDGKTEHGAPPLWCAAAFGHLNLVKCLIMRFKASVNSTTKMCSTPIHAASLGGHFIIVKYLIEHGADIEIANKYGRTNLMIACYEGHNEVAKYLVESGADVNRKCGNGKTALHGCAKSGSLDILKLLLQNGAIVDTDIRGTTPLLTAAIAGHAAIVEYFIQEFNCTKKEKINALELLGATFMDKYQNKILALNCWKRAMQLRYEGKPNPICLIEKLESSSSPIASCLNAKVRTFPQLEALISDPNEMSVQTLLIRERILGPEHLNTSDYIRITGVLYGNNGDFNRCIQLWMYNLDVQQKIQEPLSGVIVISLLNFAELFSSMVDWAVASFGDILCVFERALKEIGRALEVSQKQPQDLSNNIAFHEVLVIAMCLVGQMCTLQPDMKQSEELELKKAVYELVHLNPRARNGWTLLHLACLKETTSLGRPIPIFAFPSLEVVDLLLEVGACPNVSDLNHNTPLHIAAMNKPCSTAIFNSLLNHGAHLDVCNHERQTPLQLVQHVPLLDVYPLRCINLQCLSAKAVHAHNIPYKGFVHKKLEVFLDTH